MLTKIHHLGIVVNRLETAYGFWRDVLGLKIHKQATVADQGVKAALLPCGETEIELLEPMGEDSPVSRFLERRGPGMHHLCLRTSDVHGDDSALRRTGLRLLREQPSAGAEGATVQFVHPASSGGVLVELSQPEGGDAAVEVAE